MRLFVMLTKVERYGEIFYYADAEQKCLVGHIFCYHTGWDTLYHWQNIITGHTETARTEREAMAYCERDVLMILAYLGRI